jgi:hypothetical protein
MQVMQELHDIVHELRLFCLSYILKKPMTESIGFSQRGADAERF